MNDEPRNRHLALALDVGDLPAALLIAERVQPWFGVAKVGLRAVRGGRPRRLRCLTGQGLPGVRRPQAPRHPDHGRARARVLGRRGVDFLNFHAAGGVAMLRAGVEGLAEGARDAGHAAARSRSPCSRAIRTSTRATRACRSRDAGCDGVVCAGTDVEIARRAAHDGAGHPSRGWRGERPGARRHARRRDRAGRLVGDRPGRHRRRRSRSGGPRSVTRGGRGPGPGIHLTKLSDGNLCVYWPPPSSRR